MNRLVRSGAAKAPRPAAAALRPRRALGSEAASRQQRYEQEWQERTNKHREQTHKAARDARFTLVRSMVKWGAVGAASVAAVLAMYLEYRSEKKQPFELVGGATPRRGVYTEPVDMSTFEAAKQAEKDRLAALSPQERVADRVNKLLDMVEDESQGVSPVRKEIMLLNGAVNHVRAVREWRIKDAHTYTSKPETVSKVEVSAKGEGPAIAADDYVYLHFSMPGQPNMVYRETVKLDRDEITPALREAIVGAPSNTVLAFDYSTGSKDTSGPRQVHVQSHSDLLMEMVDDVKKAHTREQVLAGVRKRAF